MNTVTARKLTPVFLAMLQGEFHFLKGWEPSLNRADRPVTFRVQRGLDTNSSWELMYGRYNNEVDTRYTNGVTTIWLINKEMAMQRVDLHEGRTLIQDVVKPDTALILIKHVYCSLLVYDIEGQVDYVLYKNVPFDEIQEMEAREAANMAKILE